MIKTSGYRVSPTEIEEAAFSTGLVEDVVALGVADDELGQRIVLALTWRPDADADELPCSGASRRAAAVHGPRRLYVLNELPRSPNGKYDRTLPREVTRDGRAAAPEPPDSAASIRSRTVTRRRWDPRSTGWPRGSARRRSSPTTGADHPAGGRAARRAAGRGPAVYAVKANPMPAVVQHFAGLVDPLDVASAGEMRVALDTGRDPAAVSFAGPGKTWRARAAVAAGVTIELESPTEAARRRRRATRSGSARASRSGSTRTSRAWLRHADGRRAPAVRRRRRAGARPASNAGDRRRRPRRVPRLRRVPEPPCGGPLARLSAGPSTSSCAWPSYVPGRCALRQPRRWFRHPLPAKDRPLDLAAVGSGLAEVVATTLQPALPDAVFVVELGRYLVGEAGVYVHGGRRPQDLARTSPTSSSTAACTTSSARRGTSARRSGATTLSLSAPGWAGALDRSTDVVGCLCTPLDLLGDRVDVPADVAIGDLVVLFQAGAYGLTASPTAFLGHPRRWRFSSDPRKDRL